MFKGNKVRKKGAVSGGFPAPLLTALQNTNPLSILIIHPRISIRIKGFMRRGHFPIKGFRPAQTLGYGYEHNQFRPYGDYDGTCSRKIAGPGLGGARENANWLYGAVIISALNRLGGITGASGRAKYIFNIERI